LSASGGDCGVGGELNPFYLIFFFLHLWIVLGRIIGMIKVGSSSDGEPLLLLQTKFLGLSEYKSLFKLFHSHSSQLFKSEES